TAASLYYNTLFPLGVDAVLASVELIAAGTAGRLAQDESQATYDPLCRDAHAAIDWSRPITEIYNLVRGCDQQPAAYTRLGAEQSRLYDARVESTPGLGAGMIADISAAGILIGAPGGALRAKRVRAGGPKMAAVDFATERGLQRGMRCG